MSEKSCKVGAWPSNSDTCEVPAPRLGSRWAGRPGSLRRRDRDPALTGFGQRVASLVSPGLPGTHEEGDEDADAIFTR